MALLAYRPRLSRQWARLGRKSRVISGLVQMREHPGGRYREKRPRRNQMSEMNGLSVSPAFLAPNTWIQKVCSVSLTTPASILTLLRCLRRFILLNTPPHVCNILSPRFSPRKDHRVDLRPKEVAVETEVRTGGSHIYPYVRCAES